MKKVYNLTVNNFHTYFVGISGVLGHNAVIGCYPNNPTSFLTKAMDTIGLNRNSIRRYIKQKKARGKNPQVKVKWTEAENGVTIKYEVRVHEALAGTDRVGYEYRIERHISGEISPGTGRGKEYLGTDNIWYHTSELKPNSTLFNNEAASLTHIQY